MSFYKTKKLVLPVSLLVFAVYFLFSAWVADDAYITFRTVENLHNGYGLRWNVIERVQSYTHPLWMIHLVVGKYIIHDLYYLSLALGLLYTSLTIYFLYLLTNKYIIHFLLCFLLLISSKAVLDFSSSGLENSLSYFLIAAFFYAILKLKTHRYFYLTTSIILSGMFLTRMDLIIIFLPVAVFLYFYQAHKDNALKKSLLQGFLGFLPVILWSLFAVYYYGSFFANSVIAKTNTGLPLTVLQSNGFNFLYANLLYEPFTLIFILCIFITFILSKNTFNKILAIGIGLYLLYLINVGGDYMYGRFLTAPFVTGLFLLAANTPHLNQVILKALFAIAIPLSLFNLYQYTFKNPNEFMINNIGFTDERAFYYQTTGLWPTILDKNTSIADHFSETIMMFDKERADNEPVILYTMGFNGYITSQLFPDTYIIDRLGLTNSYLAAHPINYGYWRIGHFRREPNIEYINSIKSQRNLITSPNDSYVFDQVVLLSQAPLNDRRRLKAIINWHNGKTFEVARQAFTKYPHHLLLNESQAYYKNYWYPYALNP